MFDTITRFFQEGGSFMLPEPLLAGQQFDKVIQITEQSDAPISRVIGAGISRLSISPRREDIEYAMEEGLMETILAGYNHRSYCSLFCRGQCRPG